MKTIYFIRLGFYISMVILIGLTSLFPTPIKISAAPDVALAASDPVIAAAGDIACDPTNSSFNSGNGTSGSCRPKYTSDLLVNKGFAAVLPLGDNQYYCGGYQAYVQSYDLSWGRVKSITRPVVGNHEYLTSGGTDCNTANAGATGYFNYFGAAAGNRGQGYYSYDIGTWHLIALNSNCSDAGGCSSSSPQGQWLAADLAAHSNFCTLAYWHIPVFSSGGRASSNMKSIWQTLYNNNVDVVLAGHDHIYERFAPQTADGILDTARGIREFIVGSGGANHTSLAAIFPNSEVRNVDTYGVLKLTLHPTGYDWQFVPEAGKTFTDAGTGNCHGTTSGGTPIPTGSMTNTPSPTSASGSTSTFLPVADAYIDQTTATTNYGSITTLQTDNSPIKHFLVKFNVTVPTNQQIRSAKLRLFNVNASAIGGSFYQVSDNTWQENTVTWNNAPVAGTTLLASLGAVTANTWYEVNLSSLITGAGTYSLRIISTSADGADYSSREGANPPQLVIETQLLPTATATYTQTASTTPSQTPTNTSTSTFTPTLTPTITSTSSSTPTRTLTPTFTATYTSTVTATVEPSPTFTATTTNGPTQTATPTVQPSSTFTSTNTFTASPTTESTFTSTPTLISTATNTPTFTPTVQPSTPTSSSTPSLTPTSSASPTSTVTLSSGFPINQVGDNFNRANGVIGSGWSGFTTAFSISSNQLDVTSTGWNTSILWNNSSFGADQEAFVTLTQIDTASSNEQSLILKSQSNTNTTAGLIYVMYDGVGHNVQVWTYHPAQDWVQYGANIPVTFTNGDQLGARARPDGIVEVYKNGTLLATRTITAWPFYANGGYIGLWFVNAPNALLDNFGGGTR